MKPAAKGLAGTVSEESRYRQGNAPGTVLKWFLAAFGFVGASFWLENISDREQEELRFVLGLSVDRFSEIESDGNRDSTE